MSDIEQDKPRDPQAEKIVQDKRRITLLKAGNLVLEFGFIIALPLLAFGYLGKLLDERNATQYLKLIGILLALIISTTWLYRRIKEILKDLRNQ